QSTQKILLDTSFLLPTLGIEVEREVVQALSRMDYEQTQLLYSEWSLLESSWVAIRLMRQKMFEEPVYRRGLLSITKTHVYNTITMNPDDYLTALTFFQRGHSDMIDNLLYAAALREGCKFLTIDKELSRFISKNGFKNVILTPKDI
ncbi:MAG: PIN domain-containing protein, partial [Candidatus Thorarchaeota archaeon]|nr:PIN domain-containing protein [Candidatus Thorarchaeota archaeon]